MIRYVLFELLISLAGEEVCSAWFWNHFFALSKSACGGLVRRVRHFVQPCEPLILSWKIHHMSDYIHDGAMNEICQERAVRILLKSSQLKAYKHMLMGQRWIESTKWIWYQPSSGPCMIICWVKKDAWSRFHDIIIGPSAGMVLSTILMSHHSHFIFYLWPHGFLVSACLCSH